VLSVEDWILSKRIAAHPPEAEDQCLRQHAAAGEVFQQGAEPLVEGRDPLRKPLVLLFQDDTLRPGRGGPCTGSHLRGAETHSQGAEEADLEDLTAEEAGTVAMSPGN
jgi:hypothetical protein